MNQDDAQLRWALRQAALRQHRLLALEGKSIQENGLILPNAQPSPEHYHIVYNVPKENLSIPHFGEVFITAQEGYKKIFDLGIAAEPNTEWDEDIGKVGLETRLHGRADLWWIVLELAACIKARCLNAVERQNQKRRMVLVPDLDVEGTHDSQ